jgi:hypothetical protein
MRHIELIEDARGLLLEWEGVQPDTEYVLGADVALSRDTWNKQQLKAYGTQGDRSTIVVMKRSTFLLEQVFEAQVRMDAGEFGDVVAAVGAYYNHAIINVERNLADTAMRALRDAKYPFHRLYVAPASLSPSGASNGTYFMPKTAANGKTLLDALVDYISQQKLVLRSNALLAELRTIQKDNNGKLENTNGKDLAIALLMAVIVDATTDPPQFKEPPPPPAPKAPWNVDHKEWKVVAGVEEGPKVSPLDPPQWSGGEDVPDWSDAGPQGAD